MSQIEQIQKLRKMTGTGIMDCKEALAESDNDLDKAVEILREKGKAEAAKKADREASEGIVYSYIHPGSKVGVLLELNCETDFVARTDEYKDFAKEIAMQIAAASPRWVKREEVAEEEIEKEKEIMTKQLKKEGKPEHILDKIIEGKLNKFYSQNCLLEQEYIRDDSKTIKELLQETVSQLGENIKINRFARFEIGE
ncbi:MAG: translation elongation factor Ts [Elusimicrobiota bacterium]